MKKKLIAGLVVFAILGLNVSPAVNAQTTTISGTASTTVPAFLEFTLSRVVKMSVAAGDSDPFTQGTILTTPSFNFGNLVRVNDASGTFLFMRGEFFYFVLMIAATSGRRYKITETGTQLSTITGALLPKESVVLTPDYQWLDQLGGVAQGAPPTGASVGPAATASNSNALVYQSDNAGLGRLVRAVIAIAGPPTGSSFPFNFSLGHNGATGQGTRQDFTTWKPVTMDQPSGSYSGTITFTLVLN